MTQFIVHFFLCNLVLIVTTIALLALKRIFQSILSPRMQYHIWYLWLLLLFLPFLPVSFSCSWITFFRSFLASNAQNIIPSNDANETFARAFMQSSNWMQDFTVSAERHTNDTVLSLLLVVWILGICITGVHLIRSGIRLSKIKKSALPLQNQKIRKIYQACLKEMQITQEIPIRSTAFLRSPVITGLFRPCVYLPISFLSECSESEVRYILLHELQHFKTKDAILNYLMNLVLLFYWCNPLIWYARTQMQNDREMACDASVLRLLHPKDYTDYGRTLIHFAEKVSLSPFFSGINSDLKQMKRRIQNIVSYQKPSRRKFCRSLVAFSIISLLLIATAPIISASAAGEESYDWEIPENQTETFDASACFGDYEGSFVLYDSQKDSWKIYNKKLAAERISPDSTYKIYSALFALEENIITPSDSQILWDGQDYPFDAWEQDQTLASAMGASVNWYFQALDSQLGSSELTDQFAKIHYGNCNLSGGILEYWLESSLKISPIEQVEILSQTFEFEEDFHPENVDAAKDAIFLRSSSDGKLYGKTGTGRINEENVSGWFIGFVECADNTYYFATHIQADENASGSRAAEITLEVLEELRIYDK